MKLHQSVFIRLSVVIVLASVLLAMLPTALLAHDADRDVSPPNQTARSVSSIDGALLINRQRAPLTLTLALRTKLHPTLAKQLLAASNDLLPVLIKLRAQPNLSQFAITSAATAVDRRAALVSELQTTAFRSQADVLAILAGAQQADRASEIRSLWINNSIAARIDRATLLDLAARDDVAFIQPDQYRRWIEPDTTLTATLQTEPPTFTRSVQLPTSIEWHIARIRADQVWSVLNVTGTGVVVANLDTGVDWQHPALQANYRGNNPKGLPNHHFSWFDATTEGAQYPYDGYGHGTHTMGTLAGSGGIGVAPGAQWIAARIFDSTGWAYDSWIHAGFQWILAPGGDTAQAPDVLNNSWGSNDGSNVEFQPDVQLLNAAGIATFFSNGNAGPNAYSVGSPASFPESFGVGAVDETEQIAWFSSRGPSQWNALKPEVTAPGVSILSSIPGGGYGKWSGTSMAAPQVAGIAALMRSAVPGLSIAQIRYALTSTTAQPINGIYPNNTYGWGRVDALNAVLSVLQPGSIGGVVRDANTNAPLPYAVVRAESRLGTHAAVTTNETGQYTVYGPASLYTVTISAFGYVSQTMYNVPVYTGTLTLRDALLSQLPVGWVSGQLIDLASGQLLTGSVMIQEAPVTQSVHGTYALALPAGTYVLEAQARAHRVVTATLTITAGNMLEQNLRLPPAPTILLVDSGSWYNSSQISYYRQALDDLGYLYDVWPIRNPNTDVPTTSTLRAFDAVIWSSPFDAPGFINAGGVISDYLGAGGHLLLSGQDVGYYDGYLYYHEYYHTLLMAELSADTASSLHLTGTQTFAGLAFSISGPGGADDQISPDVIRSRAPLFTVPAFDYEIDQLGGQTVGLCRPYRAVNLPFGFEAITDRAARAEVLARTFGVFDRALQRHAAALDPAPDQLIAPAGSNATSTLTLYNFDEVMPVTFALNADSAWPASITPTLTKLNPCESRTITVTTQIPINLARAAAQPVTITAHPIDSAGPDAFSVLTAKAPASVLLVDDDRWIPVDGAYRSALTANGISFDVWRVPTDWAGFEPSAPSADRLSWYPQVMWFTGYDWYQPLTVSNMQALQQYLQRGGRLLLSSQDFLTASGNNDFAHQTLGVMDAAQGLAAATISGPAGSWFEGLLHQPLNTPYPNYSAALVPQPSAQPALVGDHGWPIAIAHDLGISKTLFMAFGFEGLPGDVQPEAMNRVIGYLSRLGRSRVQADRATVQPGDEITVTISATNDGATAIAQAAYTLSLPAGVTYLGGDALTWTGALPPGQIIVRNVKVKLADTLSSGARLSLPVEFHDDDQAIRFTHAVRLNVGGPELAIAYQSSSTRIPRAQVVTWTFTARNDSAASVTPVMTLGVPFGQAIVNGSIKWNTGLVINRGAMLGWVGTLAPQEVVTVSYRLVVSWTGKLWWLYGSALAALNDEVWQAGSYAPVSSYTVYLPIVRLGK
jgi:uncharacterized repeat protein (TIGR01451 family)